MQGQIIAAAIAAQATVDTDAITIDPDKLLELQAGQSGSPYRIGEGATDFPINPERVAPLLRRLISPTRTRARIYDTDGTLLLDSRGLYMRGLVQSFDLPPLGEEKSFARALVGRGEALVPARRAAGLRGDRLGQRPRICGGRVGAERRSRRASCASARTAG